ncbi:hypothetical protein [Paraburkholderia elongata]|uniref:Uncharacterized protein n=1 Tax=Paraburkholderia elongata TaxID=2675747 RepID=A0A972NK89_9BURK|nr:hypothetical protein [Paraburkholderia elongata]NPT54906.1 hypothetical protein [Paraburkholderia elongata]NPT60935.1 hypothetical protein [Paraburkholderia elongata]
MNLLNVVGTVIFLGIVALSLLAVLDVLSLRPRAKHTRKPSHTSAGKRRGNMRANTHMVREGAFSGEKADRQS